jgi:hypothetical protein
MGLIGMIAAAQGVGKAGQRWKGALAAKWIFKPSEIASFETRFEIVKNR